MRTGFSVHHNGPHASCVGRNHDRCIAFWNAVKRYHTQTKGWSDIAYSFGVCPHGKVFTGRGWHKSQWANGADRVGINDGSDRDWYTVLAFVGGGSHGDFNTGQPEEQVTTAMAAGITNLINQGRQNRYCGWRVLPHNAFKPKACPGSTLTRLASRLDNRPSPSVEENDMHGTDIITAYGEAGYFDADLPAEKVRQHWADVRAWNHNIYAKPEGERAGGVAHIRLLLGLN